MFNFVGGFKPAGGQPTHDQTFADAPETPAPVFALRAFKHAIYGTPQPSNDDDDQHLVRKRSSESILRERVRSRWASVDHGVKDHSPTKPAGILMTPGTVNGRRKQVAFGSDVVDNEARKPDHGKSGLPNHYPGKYPSPWTPRHLGERSSDNANVTDVRSLPSKVQEVLGTAEDDDYDGEGGLGDDDYEGLTEDLENPISDSGRYWKQTYEAFAERSEAEARVLISKARLAKDFAKKKDEELLELKLALDAERDRTEKERKKRHKREESLEAQVKELKGRLRNQLAENARNASELAMMRKRVEDLGVNIDEAPAVPSARGEVLPEQKQHSSRTDSVIPENFDDHFDPDKLVPEEGAVRSDISIWAAAGAPAEKRRPLQSRHIVDQLSSAGDAGREKRRPDLTLDPKLRRTTSAREIRSGKPRTSSSSTGSDSVAHSDTVLITQAKSSSPPAAEYFKPTPLSPIQASPSSHQPSPLRTPVKDSGISPLHQSRHSRPDTASSTTSLPLQSMSPNVALQRSSSDNHVYTANKNARSHQRMASANKVMQSVVAHGTNYADPLAPLAAMEALVSRPVTPLKETEQQRLAKPAPSVNQSSLPSRHSPTSSSPALPSSSPLNLSTTASTTTATEERTRKSLDKPRHVPAILAGSMDRLNQENMTAFTEATKTANVGRKKAALVGVGHIDEERVAAARARIAARKALASKTMLQS